MVQGLGLRGLCFSGKDSTGVIFEGRPYLVEALFEISMAGPVNLFIASPNDSSCVA